LYKKIFLLICLSLSLRAEEYSLGEGVQVGSLPLYLGGYFSLDYQSKKNTERYRVDDIAFIGYGNYEKFSYLAEFEFKEFYVQTQSQNNTFVTQDTTLHAERVYIDYTFNENFIGCVGKYSSPIGFWNMLPVNVLRETTSSPFTSSIIFPQFTTGLSASYNSYGENDLKIDLLVQKNQDLDAGYNNYEINEHYGIGITYTKENLSLKFNAGVFNLVHYNLNNDNEENDWDEDEENDDDNDDDDRSELEKPQRYYALASLKYDHDNFQIMSELGTQASRKEFTTEYAGYIQGLYRFSDKHSVILRGESYKENVLDTTDDIAIVGYTYRPMYPIAIKTEYQFHSQSQNDNFLVSFSMMF